MPAATNIRFREGHNIWAEYSMQRELAVSSETEIFGELLETCKHTEQIWKIVDVFQTNTKALKFITQQVHVASRRNM